MSFPTIRMRRLRRLPRLRDMVAQTRLTTNDLVYPLFVREGISAPEIIPSMPRQYRYSVKGIVDKAKEVVDLRIPAIILFGIPEHKDEVASSAYADDGVIQRAVRAIKDGVGDDLVVITDVCLCQYMSHGHCGIVKEGRVLNDPTLELLAKVAVSHAKAGADIVAPSDMMDGRVKTIRKGLDKEGFTDTLILSYAAKFASSFYGPYREAAYSAPAFDDRRTYQMDPRNTDGALREVALDIEEGADIVMVKPALPYLDILYLVKSTFEVPTAAYCVSGEYVMIKAAAEKGYIDEKAVVLEALTSIRRAGADMILTYFAEDVAKWLSRHGT